MCPHIVLMSISQKMGTNSFVQVIFFDFIIYNLLIIWEQAQPFEVCFIFEQHTIVCSLILSHLIPSDDPMKSDM
jgi:uncharacterized membrane protein